MTLSLQTITTAIDLLSGQNALSQREIARLDVADSQLAELQELSAQPSEQDSVQLSPETLDKADLFNLLSHPELIEDNRQAAVQKIRLFLGFPETDPEGVTLRFSLYVNAQGQTIAKTKIIPDNQSSGRSPIVFAGGLFHKSSVYFASMAELARQTGSEVLMFDSPGVGASVYNVPSITHKILSDSLPDVITSEYKPDQSVIVMGHSLGSITVRNLYTHPELVPNEIEKFIAVCPVPAGAEQKAGLKFSLPFMADGAVSMLTGFGHIKPNEHGYNFFYQKHDEENEWPWLEERIANEDFPAWHFQYLNVLAQVGKQSFLDEGELGVDPRLKLVLAEDDNVMRLTKSEKITQNAGVILVPNADHSFLADDETNPNAMAALVSAVLDD